MGRVGVDINSAGTGGMDVISVPVQASIPTIQVSRGCRPER